MLTVQQSLGTPLVSTPLVGTPLVDTPLVGTPLVDTPLVGTPVGTPPSPSGSPGPPSSTQSALESGAALLDGENIEVLDSKANGNFAVEVIAYKRLDGAQRFVDAQALYYANESGIRLKQVRITLRNSEVVLESGALHFMHGQLVMDNPVGGAKGIAKALKNKFLAGEAGFRPTVKGSGVIYLEPSSVHFLIVPMTGQPLIVDRGIFYCCERSIEVGHVSQKNVATAIFGGEGWFQTHLSGSGLCVLTSPVPEQELRKITLQNETLQVDGSFAIVRSAGLDFSIKKSSEGIIGTLLSGEGLIQTFQGTGEVWLAPTKGVYDSLLPAGDTLDE